MRNSAFLFLLFFAMAGYCQVNCDLTYLTTIENFDVYRHNPSNAILYRAKMAIDADGSPRAYGPNNSGLDWTANAGSPGNWWGVVTDSNGDPVIQGPGDPYPGMYVSTTSLVQYGYANTNPLRYVDSENIPFIVLPSAVLSLGNISLGDLAYVRNTANGTTSFAYFADGGPSGKLGEGSMYLAAQLGINNSPKTGGTSLGIIDYIVFPQSGYGQGTHLTIAQIDSMGLAELTAAGGAGLADCLNPALNCGSAIPLTCGVTYSGTSSTASSVIGTYGCNTWTETGPERVHTIVPPASGTITATISNFTGDLDVYILGSCDPANCLGTVSSSSATFTNAVAGQTYYVVVDADDGSGSAYDIVVSCPVVPEDITLSNPSLNPVQVNAGDTISVSVTQNYSGSQLNSGLPAIDVGYYFSADCTLSSDDTLLGTDSSDVGSDAVASTESSAFVIPSDISAGNYFILFIGDFNNELAEVNETNNSACVAITVTEPPCSIPATGTDIQTACDAFTWIDGITYFSDNNSATDTIVGGAASGCDSIVTLNLTIIHVDTSINISSDTITAIGGYGGYLWINCDNGNTVPGFTGEVFVAPASGNYSVIISEGQCTDTSACVNIVSVEATSEEKGQGRMVVFPNPFIDFITLVTEKKYTNATVKLYSAEGKIIMTQYQPKNFTLIKGLEDLEAGHYFLVFESEEGRTAFSVVKK